jgi:hypothetical protein
MSLVSRLKSLLKKLPGISGIVAQRDNLLKSGGFVPPGHFLSPLVSIDEYLRDEAEKPLDISQPVLGIDFNTSGQLRLLGELESYSTPDMFPSQATDSSRYFLPNPAFGPTDAFLTHAMMRHFKPRRLIEVGSGYSSCIILDTNQHFFDNQIELTFIEPYPQLLKSLVFANDLSQHTIVPTRLQDVQLATFEGQ